MEVHKSLVAPDLSSQLHLAETILFNQAFLVFNLKGLQDFRCCVFKLCSVANFPMQPWSGQTAISFILCRVVPARFLFLVFNAGMGFVVLIHNSWETGTLHDQANNTSSEIPPPVRKDTLRSH